MVSPNVDKIFQQVQALSDAERRELCNLLEERDSRQSARSRKRPVVPVRSCAIIWL